MAASLIPMPLPPPVFDSLLYANTEVGRYGRFDHHGEVAPIDSAVTAVTVAQNFDDSVVWLDC